MTFQSLENSFNANGLRHISGVDEVGRGPLAGPVVASAVMFPPNSPQFSETNIRDSKACTKKTREKKYWEILACARVGIGIVGEKIIDEINILQASRLAMRKAVLALSLTPEALLIDGQYRLDDLPAIEQVPIIDGDRKSISIAAASIIAKVTRDHMMEAYDATYPYYGFSKHKGYPTALHLEALKRYGPSPIHRQSFGPVARVMSTALESPY